jgi:hypothetical protein
VHSKTKRHARWRQSKKEAPMTEPKPVRGSQQEPGDEAAPGTPGTGEDICPQCGGSGRRDGATCPNCGGSGKIIRGIAGG